LGDGGSDESGSKAGEKRRKYTQRFIEVSMSLYFFKYELKDQRNTKNKKPEVHRGLRVDTPS